MSIKTLRRVVSAKWLFKDILKFIKIAFEHILYFLCCSFLFAIALLTLYHVVLLVIQDDVLKMYILGIGIAIAIVFSLLYISSYNKKYRKNDSNSPKRQNDFFFEADIRREEERYINRRNVD